MVWEALEEAWRKGVVRTQEELELVLDCVGRVTEQPSPLWTEARKRAEEALARGKSIPEILRMVCLYLRQMVLESSRQ